MKIITWNVNGIRSVHSKGFSTWLQKESPDIICLQETKANPDQLQKELINPLDDKNNAYKSFWASAKKRGYSGLVTFTKTEPTDIKFLGMPEFDDEGRALLLFYEDFVLINTYFPNSQEGGVRLPYKLSFCDAILKKCKALVKKGCHIILCGDYNIAHTPIDLARPKENEENPGYFLQEREWMDKFTSSKFTDVFRHFHPGQADCYTWWSYRAGARERNVGWRLDYFCVDTPALDMIKSCKIMNDVFGSDHCPVQIILKDTSKY
ncbi:MAG: exodeoxyribonuclease III [Termitinemataceae bacterium]|nr:MAG: exodeoxyribonuclease III [Termitinemataceae bacterium]